MSTFSIILIAYFVVAIVIMFIVLYRRQHNPRPWGSLIEKKPLWKIILPLPIYPIACIFLGLILAFDPQERRKRTILKKSLKTKDDFEKEYKELKIDKIDVESGLGDTLQKNASLCMANDLLGKDLSSFFSMLDDNVYQVLYDEKLFDRINGKSNVEHYWNNWLKRQSDKGNTHKYKIVMAKYFQTEALHILFYNEEKRYCGSSLVLFSFNTQAKIQRIVFTGEHIWYTGFLDNKQSLLSTLESLIPDAMMTDFEIKKHLPCLKCGMDSSKLIWFGYRHVAYGGKVSFCPNCKDVVEHYCNTHFYVDYSSEHFPLGDNIEYIENALSSEEGLVEPQSPRPIGIHGQVFLEPIEDVLKQCNNSIEGTIEDKLLNAANNGVYEAYNNIAIKLLNKDIEKAIEYFKLAAEHGVTNSMVNLSLWYYAEGVNWLFLNYTHQAALSGHLIGLYNAAVTEHSAVFTGAPQINKAEELYLKAIDECYRQEAEERESQKEKDTYCSLVLQYAYYNLGLLYYKDYGEYKKRELDLIYELEDEFVDLLKAYAYLNECPTQNDKVRNLKACIYKKIMDVQNGKVADEIKDDHDYEDLPF